LSCFHHIISSIRISNELRYGSVSFLLNNFNKQIGDTHTTFTHKNVDIPHPKVLMYLTGKVPLHLQKTFDLLVSQYNIDVLHKTTELSRTTLYDMWCSVGEAIDHSNSDYDYVFQFNPKYLLQNKTFRLLYPVQDGTIFLNREFDIIYTSKATMCMLYQIIRGEHFQNYIEVSQRGRPAGIFRLLHKRFVYDYLARMTFTLRDY
jgi:hypothetical protein